VTILDDDPRPIMDSPSMWPLRPVLPLKRIDGDGADSGLLFEQQGPVVRRVISTREGLDGSEIAYDSLDELVADGWRID